MLKIRKLTVRYGPLIALNEISLEVQRGEIVSLIGPNRAGKTTLLPRKRISPISIPIRLLKEGWDMSPKDATSFQPYPYSITS